MATTKDLVMDSDGDLKIANDDFVIEQSDAQNIETILTVSKSNFYQTPLIGYNIASKRGSPYNALLERKLIIEELKKDDYKVIELEIDEDFNINLIAERTV